MYSLILQLYQDKLTLLLLPKADDKTIEVRMTVRKGGSSRHHGESNLGLSRVPSCYPLDYPSTLEYRNVYYKN